MSDRWLRDPASFHGRVEMRPFDSRVLEGNALGDPVRREVPVYVPPVPGDHPVVFLLVGFTGRPHSLLDTHPWRPGVVVEIDRAIAAGEHPPHLLVLPDAWTSLGGSQYVNSPATGRYEDYLADELVPWVDQHYPSDGRRVIVGKSSGGFGALHLAMRRPGLFRACASIAGDCHFEYVYATEFLKALTLLGRYGGSVEAFLTAFRERPELDDGSHALLNVVAMAACYSGGELPFDLETGERREEVWQRWLAFDPLQACERHTQALRALDWLYLEAGRSDEFNLQYGLRLLVRRLGELGVPCEHAEFDGGHFGLNGRYRPILRRAIEKLGS